MLLDHFRPPLSHEIGWKGFHNQWASVMAADLNTRLPPGWRAYSEVEFGIEIDVGVTTWETGIGSSQPEEPMRAPTATIPFMLLTDRIEVKIVNRSYSPSLVGAIELVSPANKDRPEHRNAFVAKCQSILQDGAGLVIIDVVTERRANLHVSLMEQLQHSEGNDAFDLYASAYRPIRSSDGETQLQVWLESLALGAPLPSVPLFLRVGPMMRIDLDATYRTTCEQLRIPLESSNPNTP